MSTKLIAAGVFGLMITSFIPSPALASEAVQEDWCRLDAPGLWRSLREEAHKTGTRELEPCPTGGLPSQMPQRVVVPLPCGRNLDLVRVDIPAKSILGHIPTVIGGAPEQAGVLTSLIQGVRETTIAGSFSLSDDGPANGYKGLAQRSYWIGSHEWTALQQALVESGAFATSAAGEDTEAACAQVEGIISQMDDRRVPPATNLSWYDTQASLRALNSYVIAEGNRRIAEGSEPLVPWEQGSTGFFRLPSESEWEFAARGGIGGLTVGGPLHQIIDSSTGELRMPEAKEIAHLGTTRSGDTVAGVGGRASNVLGLYDTVGNASEMVHDLFSLVRPDHTHGAKGGMILRGGNALTPETVVGIAHRQEVSPFDVLGERRSPVAGMRVILTSPIISRGFDTSGDRAPDLPNPELEQQIATSLEELVAVRSTAGASFRLEARALLAQLQADLTGGGSEQASADQVSKVTRALEQSEAAINQAREAEIRARLRSAVDGILLIRNISAISLVWLADLEKAKNTVQNITDDRRAALEQRLSAAFANVDRRIAIIGVQVAELQTTLRLLAQADPALVTEARREISDNLRAAGITLYDEWAWPLYDNAFEQVKSAPGVDHTIELRSQLDIFATERREKYGR